MALREYQVSDGAAVLSDFIVSLVDCVVIKVDDEDSTEPPVVEFHPYSNGFISRVRPLLERLQDVILPEVKKHG